MKKNTQQLAVTRSEKFSKRNRLPFVILFFGFILIASAIWFGFHFGVMSFEQILFHFRVPVQGANLKPVGTYLLTVLPCAALLTAVFVIVAKRAERDTRAKASRWLNKHRLSAFSLVFVFGFCYALQTLGIPKYVYGLSHQSKDMKTRYVDPQTVQLTFPQQKRNLIYLFLESVESTYSSVEYGGAFADNYIPNLTRYALDSTSEQYQHFSNTDRLGGALQMPGLSWTIAGMVGQSAGIPLKLPIELNSYGRHQSFLPGATSLGDILRDAGYQQEVMMGSDASFGGRRQFYEQHGNVTISDLLAARRAGWIPPDYMTFWGFEDEKLFQFAQERISQLARSEKPFCFSFLTVDSHFPDGFVYDNVEQPFKEQYANAIFCSDQRISRFIKWFEAQPFYENTALIIVGDHLSMNKPFFAQVPESYERTIYNLFVNSAAVVPPERRRNRLFSSLDLFPSTLAAMGVKIEGDRLAYGVNLFSNQPTLAESMGAQGLAQMLEPYSSFYNETFIYD